MLATHTPRAHAVHPERGVHAVRFVALQRPSETPDQKTPAQPGMPGAPHPIVQPFRPFGLGLLSRCCTSSLYRLRPAAAG